MSISRTSTCASPAFQKQMLYGINDVVYCPLGLLTLRIGRHPLPQMTAAERSTLGDLCFTRRALFLLVCELL